MERLAKFAVEEIEKEYDDKIQTVWESEESFQRILRSWKKKYVGNLEEQRSKFINLLERRRKKEIKEKLEEIKRVKNAPDFDGCFTITIEWKPSRTWGMNPKAYTSEGYEGESIGGCGYDKLSTATAQALNSNLSIIKKLWEKKEFWFLKYPNRDFSNRDCFYYGTSGRALPYFSGGVGVRSHTQVLRSINLDMKHVSNTKWTDVFIVSDYQPICDECGSRGVEKEIDEERGLIEYDCLDCGDNWETDMFGDRR